MPKGKAVPIVLTGYLRRLLEAERTKLEDAANERAALYAEFDRKPGKIRQYEEVHVFALLKFKAILLAADGWNNKKISEELQVSQHTIGKWRREFSYILSREDLPPQRIAEFFWYVEKPILGVLEQFRKRET